MQRRRRLLGSFPGRIRRPCRADRRRRAALWCRGSVTHQLSFSRAAATLGHGYILAAPSLMSGSPLVPSNDTAHKGVIVAFHLALDILSIRSSCEARYIHRRCMKVKALSSPQHGASFRIDENMPYLSVCTSLWLSLSEVQHQFSQNQYKLWLPQQMPHLFIFAYFAKHKLVSVVQRRSTVGSPDFPRVWQLRPFSSYLHSIPLRPVRKQRGCVTVGHREYPLQHLTG